MKTIVLSLALASAAFADTSQIFLESYTPVDWIQLTEYGGIEADIGGITNIVGPEGCISFNGATFNGVTYYLFGFRWVMDEWGGGDGLFDNMPGTEPLEKLCGIARFNGIFPTMSNVLYRPVGEIHIGEEIVKFTSKDILYVDTFGRKHVVRRSSGESSISVFPEVAVEDETDDEEAEDETAVEAVSWGFLKSRAAP